MILSLMFGILIILKDFSDSSPLSKSIGNLDQIFGTGMWYPLEVIYPIASIAVFLLFGITCRNIGMKESPEYTRPKTYYRVIFGALVFGLYILLPGLHDLDDVSRVLNLHLVLGANYSQRNISDFISCSKFALP